MCRRPSVASSWNTLQGWKGGGEGGRKEEREGGRK